MDPCRRQALKAFFEHIALHPGQYDTSKEQNAVLDTIISTHHLRDRHRAKGEARSIRLTVTRYRMLLQNILRNCHGKERRNMTELFQTGSRGVREDLLSQIGYTEPSQVAGHDADGHSSAVDVDDPPGPDNEGAEEDPSHVDLRYVDSSESSEGNSNDTTSVAGGQDRSQGQGPYPGQGCPTTRTLRRSLSPLASSPLSSAGRSPAGEEDSASRTGSKRERGLQDSQAPSSAHILTFARAHPILDGPSSISSDSPEGDDVHVEQHEPPESKGSLANQLPQINASNLARGSMYVPPRPESTELVFKLGDSALIAGLSHIWVQIQSAAHRLLDGFHLDHKADAKLVQGLSDLEPLYQRIFGKNWEQRARKLKLAEQFQFSMQHLVEACTAAALYDTVWTAEAPWKGATDIPAKLAPFEDGMNKVLRSINSPYNARTLAWQTMRTHFMTEAFSQTDVQPYAKKLADGFMFVLSDQMIAFRGPEGTADGFTGEVEQGFTAVFKDALLLRTQMRASRDYYRFGWPRSGIRLDSTFMEQLVRGTAAQEVGWTLMPLVQKKTRPDSGWQVVCKAKVYTRPLLG